MQRILVRVLRASSVAFLIALAVPAVASAQTPALPDNRPPSPNPAPTSTDIHPELWPQAHSGVAADPAVDVQVADLLSKMALEDKVGQVIQPDVNSVTLDDIRTYHFGSVLNGGGSGPNATDQSAPPHPRG
jgi:beta-glucosidase